MSYRSPVERTYGLTRHARCFGDAVVLAVLAFARLDATTVIFEHRPESNSTFVSHHILGGPVLADDFDPAGILSGPVVLAEWWGTSAQSPQWELTLHLGQIGGGGFGIPQATPASTGGTKYFVNSVGVDPDGDGIFYFSASLPGTFSILAGPRPFGSEYWFSAANAAGGWTWAFAGAGPTVGDEHWSAVRSVGSTPCGDGGPHCGAWSALQGRDFAFRLSAIPEPSTWMMLLTGIVLVAIGRLHK